MTSVQEPEWRLHPTTLERIPDLYRSTLLASSRMQARVFAKEHREITNELLSSKVCCACAGCTESGVFADGYIIETYINQGEDVLYVKVWFHAPECILKTMNPYGQC